MELSYAAFQTSRPSLGRGRAIQTQSAQAPPTRKRPSGSSPAVGKVLGDLEKRFEAVEESFASEAIVSAAND